MSIIPRSKILPVFACSASLIASLSCLADHVGLQIDGGAGSAITTMGAETLSRSQQVMSLQYQYVSLDELSDETLLESDESLHSVSDFSQLSIGYSLGISDRFTLSAVLPYVSRDGFREAEHNHHDESGEAEHHDEDDEAEHHDENGEAEDHDAEAPGGEIIDSDISGWGDLSLLGRFALNGEESNSRYALLAGLKTPTGSTSEKLANGERAEIEHQPGSGSWDPLMGIAMSSQLSPQWSVSSNLLYQLTTEGQRDTEIGDSLMYNGAIIWSPATHSHQGSPNISHVDQSWQLVLELNGEWRDKTRVNGHSDKNTGGNVIFASAGARWSYGAWSTHIAFNAPIQKNFNGLQSEPDWRLSSAVTVAF
ncbi:MAG: transporter [Proteobacteria bacterium]|nr:transporter [Pseudomonadota bacterium]